jgi:hypothetical protein
VTFKQRWTDGWYLAGLGTVAIVMTTIMVTWQYVAGEDLEFWKILAFDVVAFTSYNVTWYLFGMSAKVQARKNR